MARETELTKDVPNLNEDAAFSERLLTAMGDLDTPAEIAKLKRVQEHIRGTTAEMRLMHRLVLCAATTDRP